MRFNYLLILFFLFLSFNPLDAQEKPITFQKIERVYTVFPATNSFTTEYSFQGNFDGDLKNHVLIHFGELETISEIKASYQLFGKWKKLAKKNFITNNIFTSSFYDGMKETTLKFPFIEGGYPFQYAYKKETSDLLFLASLRFRDTDIIDTFHYTIQLPVTHKLHYQMEDSLKQSNLVEINSFQKNEMMVYEFVGIPKKEGNYPTTNSATIRMMVVPIDRDPFDHYNDWYQNLVRPKANLSSANKKFFIEKVADKETDKEKVETIFNTIKDRTSYIAFEDGIGAVQPRDVNKIFTAQQGDCKDMSNLLVEALKAVGYDAKIALSSTIGHPFKLDFPSVSSANHAICVLQLGDEWLYLDATEDAGFFGMRSRQIQGRSVFVIDSDKGFLKEVPKVKAENNVVDHVIHLKKEGNGLNGSILFKYCGLSQLWLRNQSKRIANSKLENALTDYLSTKASNLIFEKVDLEVKEKICEIKSNVATERNFTNIKDKTYLSLAFLPDPFVQSDDVEKTTLKFYEAVFQDYTIHVELDVPIKINSFEKIDVDHGAIRFQFEVTQVDDKNIQIKYKYVNELLELKDENLENFRIIKNIIKKTLRKSIIYETIK